ncbi:hypothetical protein GSI_08734 [Ganoderma sinense ZZ0214-1]|uniref:Uncharacterized protein n=1 Tax=Ganoderma sinense ZZ0214-1 TaxID=1077348 RepID=A0A2G8S4I9_9APHY|nr:hypothetical protein GSI_08734 [Ganoderma sinense ZZ0214-1]
MEPPPYDYYVPAVCQVRSPVHQGPGLTSTFPADFIPEFADVVRSDLYLQYKLELAKNGMVDGEASTLPLSERLQRLREYSSRFCSGIFDYEDISAYPDFALRLHGRTVPLHHRPLSDLYTHTGRSDHIRSAFIPGSTQAGIQSSRCMLPVGTAAERGLVVTRRAADRTQDLLVMAEVASIAMPRQGHRPDEIQIRFYSLRGCGSKPIMPAPHPAATLPVVLVSAGMAEIQPVAQIVELHIAGQHVIWEVAVMRGDQRSVFVEVYDWKAGEVISRIDIGTALANVVPLDYPYFLVLPRELEGDPHLSIYSCSPTPGHPICALRLRDEDLQDDERIDWHTIHTGDRPQPSEGHFHADFSQSTVVLQFFITGRAGERETHYLIPRATLLAHILDAESRADGDRPKVRSVPWADWGPRGCLRLCLRCPHAVERALMLPFGSRLPLLVVNESDFRSAAVYVFDVNPLIARHQRRVLATRQHDSSRSEESGRMGIIEDIEAVLPGVVDPHCARIPYVAYRFPLPRGPVGWRLGHMVSAVIMSMTGFTVKMAGVVFEKSEQTWTI